MTKSEENILETMIEVFEKQFPEAEIIKPRPVSLDQFTYVNDEEVYMTNTPTTLPELVIRQTDNIFIFNLTNDRDINQILPATEVDPETITSVAKSLAS